MNKKYCLDSNCFIEAWNKYYSPKFCDDYWNVLSKLGEREIIFVPYEVSNEIIRTDDNLARWLKNSDVRIFRTDEKVQLCLKDIYAFDPSHIKIIDNTKGRSLADPWVIAHAMKEKAVVVTKEEKVTQIDSTRIKIPNICDNMGVEWINDFQFIEEMNIKFSCGFPE